MVAGALAVGSKRFPPSVAAVDALFMESNALHYTLTRHAPMGACCGHVVAVVVARAWVGSVLWAMESDGQDQKSPPFVGVAEGNH